MYSHEHGCKGRGFFDYGNDSSRIFLKKAAFIDTNQCFTPFFIGKVAYFTTSTLLQNFDGDGL
ncbi:MAG: hypothetical protein IKZ83_04110, partial [Prevotella sp.]|nr:hypothetical protein [Prevotella sp.]